MRRSNEEVLATKRVLRTHEFAVTRDADTTHSMETFLAGVVDYVSQDGIPTIFHFYLTKNGNMKLTDENGLLNLNIPMIPVAWNTASDKQLEDFKKSAVSTAEIKKRVQALNPAEYEIRVNQDTKKMYNFIRHELGNRYLIAKENADPKTMAIISKLDVMKDFDFDTLDALNHRQTTHAPQRVLLDYSDYLKTKQKYMKLLRVMQEYRDYNITAAKNGYTVPSHSAKAKPTQPGQLGE